MKRRKDLPPQQPIPFASLDFIRLLYIDRLLYDIECVNRTQTSLTLHFPSTCNTSNEKIEKVPVLEKYIEISNTKAETEIKRINNINGDLYTIEGLSTGQVMNTPIEGLKPMTTYGYRAFVRTATKTIYGEELSFTPPPNR